MYNDVLRRVCKANEVDLVDLDVLLPKDLAHRPRLSQQTIYKGKQFLLFSRARLKRWTASAGALGCSAQGLWALRPLRATSFPQPWDPLEAVR